MQIISENNAYICIYIYIEYYTIYILITLFETVFALLLKYLTMNYVLVE